MKRWAPLLVSLIGIVGLSLAMTYMVAVILAFLPGYERITFFLVGRSDLAFSYNFLLVLVPYALLVVYLFARTRLGSWMLDKGWVDEAREYAATRTKTGVLRSRQEALHHRLTLARAEALGGQYESARDILMDPANLSAIRGGLKKRWIRWALEVALRRENAVEFESAWEKLEKPTGTTAADLWACRAEILARKADYDGFARALANARFADSKCSRITHAEAVAKLRMPGRGRGAASILQDLVSTRDDLVRMMPFLRDELEALIVFLEFSGDPACASELKVSTTDSRTRFVVSEVRDAISIEHDSEE